MKRKVLLSLLSVSILFLFTACGGGNTQETTAISAQTTQDSNPQTEKVIATETQKVTEPETPATETSTPKLQTKGIGETGTIGDWSITISNMQISDSISVDYGSYSPDDGNKYLILSGKVENNGKESATFLPMIGTNKDINAKILYGDGYEFTASNFLGYDNDLHDSSINPLSSKEGDITFEIPDSVAGSDEELLLKLSADSNELIFKIR